MSRFFNNLTDLENDDCEILVRDKNNERISNFSLNEYQFADDLRRQGYMNSHQETGVHRNTYGLNIGEECNLRNNMQFNNMTTDGCRKDKQLDHSLFIRPPIKASGMTRILADNVAENSKITRSVSTSTRKSVNTLSGATIDRFEPLVPWLEKHIKSHASKMQPVGQQTSIHTRAQMRNCDYKKRCLK